MPADGEYLGKIERCALGFCRDRNRFGLDFTLNTEVGCVDGFMDLDALELEGHAHEEELVERFKELQLTLKRSKRQHVHQLPGTPIRATFKKSVLVSWRVLTEVL